MVIAAYNRKDESSLSSDGEDEGSTRAGEGVSVCASSIFGDDIGYRGTSKSSP